MSETITSASATARYVRVTPMKARRVIDLVRGKSVAEALAILKYARRALLSQSLRSLLLQPLTLRTTSVWTHAPWSSPRHTPTRARPCVASSHAHRAVHS